MIGIGAAAIWLTSTGFLDQYDDLVRKGYRWVTSDGPFACRSKEDLQRIIKDQSDENTLRMVSQGGVYFPNTRSDSSGGAGGQSFGYIADSLGWTRWESLDEANTQLDVTATPGASAIPTHGETAEAAVSPTP